MSTLSALDDFCRELQKIEEADPVTSAIYREQAQDILATPTIALKVRTAIADYLSQINQRLALKTVEKEDSY